MVFNVIMLASYTYYKLPLFTSKKIEVILVAGPTRAYALVNLAGALVKFCD